MLWILEMKRRWSLAVFALVVIGLGATAGAIWGERSLQSSEEELVLRASRIVNDLIEWLPEEREPSEIVYDGIRGMLEVLDPHSNFLDPSTFRAMRTRQEGSFFGVGIIISRRQGKVTVIAPMAGTPAAAKGLRAGDVIAAVSDESTDTMNLDDVVELVRGPEGTEVRLTIERPGLIEPFTVEITRTRIPTNSVRFAFMLQPEVGYIRLTEFTNTSTHEVAEAIGQLEREGMKRLVFDLRDNPGGQLDAAVGVANTFLAEGQLVVSTRGRTTDSFSTLLAPGDGVRFEGPLVVLVNEGSASASEIVAGSVQDHDRGLLVGDITWGKGLVQTVYTIRGTGLALTTARYYTASGRCIQRDYDSYIDYITHRNGTPTDTQAEAFSTESGRTVLGGGGITPDVTIEGRELTEGVVRLFGQSAFFRFAIQLLKDIPEAQQSGFAERLDANPVVLEDFWKFVTSQEILTPEDMTALQADTQAVQDISRTIRVEVVNATLGLEAGYRVVIEADEQLQAALEHLDDAAALVAGEPRARGPELPLASESEVRSQPVGG